MRKLLKLILFVVALCMSNDSHAQAVVTEYTTINGAFFFNPKDKRLQKLKTDRGILDITFDADKRILAITYPSTKPMKVQEIVADIKKLAATPYKAE
jgi:hypothetical protein